MCALDQRVQELSDAYLACSQIRDPRLFTIFLYDGYRMTTLPSVDRPLYEDLIAAKVALGMLITLYDDLADNPRTFNPRLLAHLYRLDVFDDAPVPLGLGTEERKHFALAVSLLKEIRHSVIKFPHAEAFGELLSFDLQQFYISNRYSELQRIVPGISNLTESKLYGPYNMGMVIAGMLDLMASSRFDHRELGRAREIFLLGQRCGRIGNLLSTYEREKAEGDLTNEIIASGEEPVAYQIVLRNEVRETHGKLERESRRLTSVDFTSYVAGVEKLFDLHRRMEGII